MMNVWLVVQFRDDGDARWEFQGVFDSKERAEKACRTADYCVAGPYLVNAEIPHERIPM
jgi:hypothetical protein